MRYTNKRKKEIVDEILKSTPERQAEIMETHNLSQSELYEWFNQFDQGKKHLATRKISR
jgi:transposase-like protein